MRNISGNEAVALAALHAGATVITGYPGTPSSEAVQSLWGKQIEGVEVQWSTNEKVALEVASAAAWAGQRALCTMKMSGLNVAYDSLISIVYSGCTGALVLYVCDDPGVSAGMPEQDVRGFAKMSDMPVIDLESVEESYARARYAFELSEKIGSPVMLRSVTSVSLSHAALDLPEPAPVMKREAKLEKNIAKYTKAGAKICMDQHAALLESLEKARAILHEDCVNALVVADGAKLGLVAAGVMGAYIEEGIALARQYADIGPVTTLHVVTTVPAPTEEFRLLLESVDTIAVVEENEPYVEHALMLEASRQNKHPRMIGKEDNTFSRIGALDASAIAKALLRAVGKTLPDELVSSTGSAAHCAARPIGVCAGCPHRGVFMSINKAVKALGYKQDDVIVTGDIGCTILGMSPPFNTLWTEVSMGASIPMAQGFVHAGIKTPLIATIGDSTFIHGGMPGLVNAVWANVDLTAIVMDNGWTCMTGMQVNPGTADEFQQSKRNNRVDIQSIIPAIGVAEFVTVDPYDTDTLQKTLVELIPKPGVKVILARRECAIQSNRRKIRYNRMHIDDAACTRCKICIRESGCPALVFDGEHVAINQKLCNGCAVCKPLCKFDAIVKEEVRP